MYLYIPQNLASNDLIYHFNVWEKLCAFFTEDPLSCLTGLDLFNKNSIKN